MQDYEDNREDVEIHKYIKLKIGTREEERWTIEERREIHSSGRVYIDTNTMYIEVNSDKIYNYWNYPHVE